MSSKREQIKRQTDTQAYGENLLVGELAKWTDTVIAAWSPGTSVVPQGTKSKLRVILRRSYDKIAAKLLGVDYRLYKQDDEPDPFDEAMRAIAASLAAALAMRLDQSSAAITNTLREMMRRASAIDAPDMTQTQRRVAASSDLGRRMRNHRLIIGVTESGWTVNTTHRTAILAVKDPLGNSVERIAQLFEAGQNNEARKLARQVMRLAKLPTSVAQGDLIRTVSDVRDTLMPEGTARAIASMRQQAAKLGSEKKVWVTMQDELVRPTHAAAHGQEREPDEPFVVGGSQLQYPGDTALGAPLSEVVNCRCVTGWLK